MILAAGLGTRLAPLTSWRAKALVPLGDRPLLAHLAEKLTTAGVDRLVVNAHHRADEVAAFVRDCLQNASVSAESELLGTAGGVAHARDLLGDGDVLIWNADIVADVNADALFAAHVAAQHNGAVQQDATLVVRLRPPGEGAVGVDANGKVVRLRTETTAGGELHGGDFLGIHVVGARLREGLPEVGCLVADLYLPAMRRGARLGIFPFAGAFWDVGSPASYLAANVAWLETRGLPFWRAPTAEVATGVVLERSVIGERARVEGTGALENCVIWPGARVIAPKKGTIVAPEGEVTPS